MSRPQQWNELVAGVVSAGCDVTAVMVLAVVVSSSVLAADVRQGRVSGCREGLNVILISIDTLRADHVGLYGYERDTSPNLERFAEEAMVFEAAYSNSSVTAPSHMSLFTGMYPISHRIEWTYGEKGVALDARFSTLAEILDRAGYRTVRFANSKSQDLGVELGFGRGFDEIFSFGLSASLTLVDFEARSEADLARIVRWFEENPESPFFAFIHNASVHDPYVVPNPYDRMFDPEYRGRIIGTPAQLYAEVSNVFPQKKDDYYVWRDHYWSLVDRRSPQDVEHLKALYDAAIRWTDGLLGRLFDRLEKLGVMENTIIFITSDHGEAFGERGNFLHYQELYDEILHVPLIVRVPGMGGDRKSGLVQSVDIMPTILECLGMNVPDSADGRSFLEVMTGEQSSVNEFVFAQFRFNYTIRSTNWKFIRRASLSEELYDLARDPDETENVVGEQTGIRDAYARVLDTFVLRSLGKGP